MGGLSQVSSRALEGLDRAEANLQRAADRIARVSLLPPGESGDPVNLSKEILSLLEARTAYRASLRALKATEELQGLVIDVLG